jgi:hypothetical protein
MDLSTYWVFWQRHKQKSGQLLLLIIFFIGGWYLGQVTSPYYQASPIVFEDNACERASGTAEDINALVTTTDIPPKTTDEAVASTDSDRDNSIAANSPAVSPQIAGSSADAPTQNKKFVGSINSDLFHDPTCSASKNIKESNQIWFASVEEARQAGYTPSKCTEEKLGL